MTIIQNCYVLAAIFFILGIKFLNSPETARRGMHLALVGMIVAIVGTLFNPQIVTYAWIFGGLVLGTLVSLPISLGVPMTHVPQRIALSHASGALAACLIGIAEYYRSRVSLDGINAGVIGAEAVLSALTFTGSLMVASKLHGLLPARPITYRGQNVVNLSLFTVMIALLMYLILHPAVNYLFYTLLTLSLLFGVFLVTPIGAADMPVVIAIFNAYGGLVSAIMGFMLANRLQIITGALDGASGFILSMIMCKAMNRSLSNVLLGAFGKTENVLSKNPETGQAVPVKSMLAEEALLFFEQAKSVIVIPGYGMAASQAHYALRELVDKLKGRNINIKYAIHPVAGRMPGHMNVLLAEANVPYTDLYDLEDINPEFPHADLALVIGANDVTNPAARLAKSSPIYGMPILDVDKAKRVLVCKRSMNPGFSGIENDLYTQENTWLIFDDAKASLNKLAYGLKRA